MQTQLDLAKAAIPLVLMDLYAELRGVPGVAGWGARWHTTELGAYQLAVYLYLDPGTPGVTTGGLAVYAPAPDSRAALERESRDLAQRARRDVEEHLGLATAGSR